MNIVGLGNAGCQIAKNFEKYEQYKVFCIDVEDKGYTSFLSVEKQNSHENYEKNYKALNLTACKARQPLSSMDLAKLADALLGFWIKLKTNLLQFCI